MNLENNFSIQSFLNKFGTLEEISSRYLLIIISNLEKTERNILFNNKEIKSKIISEAFNNNDYWAYFRNMLKYLTVDEVLTLFDLETVKKVFSGSEGHEYKLYAALCEKDLNETIKCVLSDDELFDYFFKQSDKFYSILSSIPYDLCKRIVLKMQEQKFPYPSEFLSIINSDNQIKLLDEDLSDDSLVYLVNNFREQAQRYFFLHHEKAVKLFARFDLKYFITKGVEFNPEIIKRNEFFELIKGNSLIEYRRIINSLEKNQDLDIVEKRVNAYYHELLSSFDSDNNMFKEYVDLLKNPEQWPNTNNYIVNYDVLFNIRQKSIDEAKEYLINITSKKISEIVVDALFKDNIYNVWVNIKEMLRYNSKLEDKVISSKREHFYQMILNIDKMSSKDKIALYYKFKDHNIAEVFYDDLRTLKDKSYEVIKNNLFNVNDINEYDEEKYKEYGVKIIDMRDKEFMMLIKGQDHYFSMGDANRSCYSLISHENTNLFGHGYLKYYGYNNFPIENVSHVLEQDSFSADLKDETPSKYVNRIMTPEEIVQNSTWYSEIDIVNEKAEDGKYIYQKPDYLVVYNSLNYESLNEAKRLNIPIVIIRERYLDRDKKYDIPFDEKIDIYVDNDYYERDVKETR